MGFKFQRGLVLHELCGSTCARFPVALPLGINGHPQGVLLVVSTPITGSLCPYLKPKRPGDTPRLPRQQRGSIVEHRQWRVLLFAVGERQQWGVFEFRGGESLSQQRLSPCLRFPVALPLGINGHPQGVLLVVSTPITGSLCPYLKPKRPGDTPRLPRQQRGSIVEHRQWRVLLFAVGERQQWGVFEFRGGESLSQQRLSPCLRFSVALPLGINGAERHAVGKRLGYPTLLDGLKPAEPKSNVSCGPPLAEASARAALRAAEARPTVQPNSRPNSPPRVRLTAVPLSLRRILPSPAAILAGLATCQPAEYAFFGGRATDFCARSKFFARRGKSCQNAQAHFDDFPL